MKSNVLTTVNETYNICAVWKARICKKIFDAYSSLGKHHRPPLLGHSDGDLPEPSGHWGTVDAIPPGTCSLNPVPSRTSTLAIKLIIRHRRSPKLLDDC